MERIPFSKMHGAGNDYIYVNTLFYDVPQPSEAASLWRDRHTCIGADGLVLIGLSQVPEADFTMRMFNADGSEGMMCGNAARCIGKYLYERGLTDKTEIRLLTLSGVKTLWLTISSGKVESVTVDMGEPLFKDDMLFVPNSEIEQGVFVSMGNPHYVVFTNDVDQVDKTGPLLEHHPAFPQRCNIEFARMESESIIRTRVWERGSGVTMACGTGACATAVAAALTRRAERTTLVVMDGGTLSIEWREADNHVYMTGPAEFVFDGEIKL